MWVPGDALIKSVELAHMQGDSPEAVVTFYRRMASTDDGAPLYSREAETATVTDPAEIRRIWAQRP